MSISIIKCTAEQAEILEYRYVIRWQYESGQERVQTCATFLDLVDATRWSKPVMDWFAVEQALEEKQAWRGHLDRSQ